MTDRGNLSGVGELMSAAASGRNDSGYSYYLSGDLCQMSKQKEFLSSHGMTLGQKDVYPVLETEDDFKEALALLWKYRVAGWWNYQKQMVEYGICTKDEHRAALDVECAKEHRR